MLTYESGMIKNIHYGDIHTKFRTHFDVKKEFVPYLNSNVTVTKIHSDCFLKEGDLIIADASEDYNEIGKTMEVINTSGEKLVAGLHTFLARKKKNNVTIGFGGHMFKSFEMRLKIMKIAQGTKVLSISTTRLSNIDISLPSLPEQQKIATFLYSLDASIESIGVEIDGTMKFKKGLLQKMFV